MNPIRRSLLVSTISLIGFLALSFLVNCYGHRNSTAYNFFFTPDDFWTPLMSSNMDLTKKNNISEGTIIHYYPGSYSINVSIKDMPNVSKFYDSDVSLGFMYSMGEDVILSARAAHAKSFYTLDGDSVMMLYFYDVPGDVPIREEVSFNANVTRPNSDVTSEYQHAVLEIKKMSDG